MITIEKLKRLDEIVKDILQKDKLAREDDNYLIFRVIQRIKPNLAGATFAKVMFSAKSEGISFESITRIRRKMQQKYPELCNKEIKKIRENEKVKYKKYATEE